jgi:molybdopterin-containing oxidoreductase family membrane subunit
MSATSATRGLIGVFAHEDALLESLRQARARGIEIRDVFSPVPLAEAEELLAPRRSPVRFITFAGAVLGLGGGMALALGTAAVWHLVVGGKPPLATVPFVVVGFEMTILLGALATLAGLLCLARLPFRRFPGPGFRPAFTRDRFGLWLVFPAADEARARALLTETHAVEVEVVVEPPGGGRAP